MNIEEARKVLWLKSNHRPLGELLDEGYLTKDRLEWAARWAYNSKLKQAAQVILDSMKHSPSIIKVEQKPKASDVKKQAPAIEVELSLDNARSTLWPFSSHKDQPMGELLDSRQLSLRDLGYAIETAWDPKVKQAATTLALVRLNQVIQEPEPPAGFVRVVSGGRSYSEREQLRLTLLEGFLVGMVFTGWLGLVGWLISINFKMGVNPRPAGEILSTPAGMIAIVVLLVLFLFIIWLVNSIPDWITKNIEKQIENHHRGQEGEEKTVQSIVQALDGNWHLFRNIQLPGRNKGDLDLVLVGPPGIWALEVKNFNGIYHNIGETWQYKQGKNWKNLRKSPTRQASNNSLRLKNFLKADGVNLFVNDAIVWANPESLQSVENPTVAVWRFNRLADELGNIWQGEKLSKLEQSKIVEKLTKLCERQKKSNS